MQDENSLSQDFETLLEAWNKGDQNAYNQIFEWVYPDIKKRAHYALRGERDDHTLGTTALAHEAFLKMMRFGNTNCNDRKHFLNLASRAMHQILIDYSKKPSTKLAANKSAADLDLNECRDLAEAPSSVTTLMDQQTILKEIEALDELVATVARCKIIIGLTLKEIAQNLDISESQASEKWKKAKFLYKRIANNTASPTQN